MSTATEMAELEAAIAEAELEDEDEQRVRELVGDGQPIPDAIAQATAEREERETAPPPAQEPPAEVGEPTDDQLRKLEREQSRHENRVREIMGGHVAGFEACDHCGGVGLVPPGPRPRTHEWFIACETCNGFGEVLTGSQRQGQESRDCPACKGRGYLEALAEDGTPLASSSTGPQPIVPAPVAPVALEPAELNGGQQKAPRFGTPSWMGDTTLGS